MVAEGVHIQPLRLILDGHIAHGHLLQEGIRQVLHLGDDRRQLPLYVLPRQGAGRGGGLKLPVGGAALLALLHLIEDALRHQQNGGESLPVGVLPQGQHRIGCSGTAGIPAPRHVRRTIGLLQGIGIRLVDEKRQNLQTFLP